MNIVKSLEEYGLSENESKVYMYLIQHTDTNAYDLAKGTNIARTTVYNTLESLKAMNLVTEWKKNGVSYFGPESPNRLKQMLKEKEEVLEKVMPEIRSIAGTENKLPKTKVYVGENSVRMGLTDVFETVKNEGVKERYVYTHPDLVGDIGKFFSVWAKRKEDLKVFSRVIAPESIHEGDKAPPSYMPNKYREVRYIPDKYLFGYTFDITGSRIAFYSTKKGDTYTIIVYSEAMADVFRQMFMFMWDTLSEEG